MESKVGEREGRRAQRHLSSKTTHKHTRKKKILKEGHRLTSYIYLIVIFDVVCRCLHLLNEQF